MSHCSVMSAHRDAMKLFNKNGRQVGLTRKRFKFDKRSPTDVVFLFAGDGIAADLSVLDG